MSIYSGRLWLEPDRESKLRVEIELEEERIKITGNDTVIGEWGLSELEVGEMSVNTVHLLVEGEELVVTSRDPNFMPALVDAGVGDSDAHVIPFSRIEIAAPQNPSLDQDVEAVRAVNESPSYPSESTSDQSEPAGPEEEPSSGSHRSEGRMLWKW